MNIELVKHSWIVMLYYYFLDTGIHVSGDVPSPDITADIIFRRNMSTVWN